MACEKSIVLISILISFIAATTCSRNSHHSEPANNQTQCRKLKLIHRDELFPSHEVQNYSQRFNARIQRDIKRVAGLSLLLSPNQSYYQVEGFQFGSDVVSGLSQGIAEFLVRVEIGNPPVTQHLAIDTGSDLTWIQCHPCKHCYPQSDPIFSPSDSRSYSHKTCGSQACDLLGNLYDGCKWLKNECTYKAKYLDGSISKGTLIAEEVTIGGIGSPVAIGCGNRNKGNFKAMAGIMGLGSGSISFVNQLGDPVRGGFSYCLSPNSNLPTGWLEFGLGSLPEDPAWVPLQYNLARASAWHYIRFSGISVGNVRLPIPEDAFKLTESGQGGVILDSGSVITRFPRAIYEMLRDSFVAQTQYIPRAPPRGMFDTCYDYSGPEQYDIPQIRLYFPNNAIVYVGGVGTMIRVDGRYTYCFAFAPFDFRYSIIGNAQQEGIQVSFDLYNGRVAFGPQSC